MRQVTEYFDKITGEKASHEERAEKFGKSITDNYDEWKAWLEENYDIRDRFVETPYERTRRQVYATGNRWAIENFNATH